MLKLGHIVYANCVPVHAGILDKAVDFPFELVEGIPSQLNRLLFAGGVDVSPSSSIEYALHPGRYRIMPGLSITSKDAALSIILESRFPLELLDAKRVALTTASATSNVLLRVVLEIMTGVRPEYGMYEQGVEDPLDGVDALLTIGDLALHRAAAPRLRHVYDLGEVWRRHTGLPFVFALWQINYRKDIDNELGLLYDILSRSKRYGLERLPLLAERSAPRFGFSPDTLLRYWNTFSYDFGISEQQGLLAYYAYAAELGVIARAPELSIWTP